MRRLLNRFATIALCLVMILTAQATGMVRAQPGAQGYAVICTGSGPVMVELDSKGEPVSRHYCPDGALALLAAVATPMALLERPVGAVRILTIPEGVHLAALRPQPAQARGPPVPV